MAGERGQQGLTSPSCPCVDAAGLSASGFWLCRLHGQRSEVGVISPARGLQGQDILGESFVEPGPRPLPDLGGETSAWSTRCRVPGVVRHAGLPSHCFSATPSGDGEARQRAIRVGRDSASALAGQWAGVVAYLSKTQDKWE